MTTGTLYLVASPLGHLGDITVRAAELLRRVPVVAAEDTRRTRTLLTHLGAAPTVLSYHAHSPPSRVEEILHHLQEGRDVALVTDAGTPALSDPGPELVRRVRALPGPVVPLPGPSAVTTALSAAGFPADRFVFAGFLPRRGTERREALARVAGEPWTTVVFEAPGRLVALLQDLVEVAGADREALVARELTKVHEDLRAGSLAELAEHYRDVPPRGEVTVVLAGAPPVPPDEVPAAVVEARATALVAEGRPTREVVRLLVEEFEMARNAAYRVVVGLS